MTTRRAVLGTVAWTLPTVMVSVAAPAIAASATRDSLEIGRASCRERV